MTNDITILNEDIYFRQEPNSNKDILKFAIYSPDKTRMKFLSSGNVYNADKIATPDFNELGFMLAFSIRLKKILNPILKNPKRHTPLEDLLQIEKAFVEFQQTKNGNYAISETTEEYYNF